jgi:hypothetical protein
MMVKSKFCNITFPAFGLLQTPFDYRITLDTIEIQKKEFGSWTSIDRFDRNKTLLERYLSVKEEGQIFDVTCLNLSQLISRPIKWVIDARAKIHDLSRKQEFKAKNVKVVKIVKNAIWLHSVSYPFVLPSSIIDPQEILNQHATIVYIDSVWILHKFTPFSEQVEMLKL